MEFFWPEPENSAPPPPIGSPRAPCPPSFPPPQQWQQPPQQWHDDAKGEERDWYEDAEAERPDEAWRYHVQATHNDWCNSHRGCQKGSPGARSSKRKGRSSSKSKGDSRGASSLGSRTQTPRHASRPIATPRVDAGLETAQGRACRSRAPAPEDSNDNANDGETATQEGGVVRHAAQPAPQLLFWVALFSYLVIDVCLWSNARRESHVVATAPIRKEPTTSSVVAIPLSLLLRMFVLLVYNLLPCQGQSRYASTHRCSRRRRSHSFLPLLVLGLSGFHLTTADHLLPTRPCEKANVSHTFGVWTPHSSFISISAANNPLRKGRRCSRIGRGLGNGHRYGDAYHLGSMRVKFKISDLELAALIDTGSVRMGPMSDMVGGCVLRPDHVRNNGDQVVQVGFRAEELHGHLRWDVPWWLESSDRSLDIVNAPVIPGDLRGIISMCVFVRNKFQSGPDRL